MPLTDQEEIPIRTCVIFFVIDTSGSMEGSKIGALNAAIEDFIPEIRKIADEYDVQIEIAVLGFSTGARWLTANGPVEASQFNWESPVTEGTTDLGAAYRALDEKLSIKAFMQPGGYAPVIFLIMDGEPSDDWKSALAELRENTWFNAASKCAIAIGDDVDRDVLKEFTDFMEAVLKTFNIDVLKKVIISSFCINDDDDFELSELEPGERHVLRAFNEARTKEEKTTSPDTEREEW